MAVIVPILSTFNAAGINAATGALARLGGSMKKLGAQAALAAAGVKALGMAVDFVSESVTAARDLERNLYSLNTVFGELSPKMVQFTKDAANMGISQVDAARTATFLGSVLKQAGFSMADTATETQKLTVLAQDLATTYGYDVSEALTAMTALFRGEYDPIEKFGVALKQDEVNSLLAAKGLGELTGQAKLNAQQQVRLEQLYLRSADAQGAFAAQSESLYGVQGRLSAAFENTKAALGEGLLPVMAQFGEMLIPIVGDSTGKLEDGFKGLGDTMKALAPLVEPVIRILVDLIGALGLLLSALAPLIEMLSKVLAGALIFIADAFESVGRGIDELMGPLDALANTVNGSFGGGVTAWLTGFLDDLTRGSVLLRWIYDLWTAITGQFDKKGTAEQARQNRERGQAQNFQDPVKAPAKGGSGANAESEADKKAKDAAKKRAAAFAASLKASKEAAEKTRQAFADLRASIDDFNKGFVATLAGFKEMFAFSTPMGEFEQKTVDAFQNITDAAKDAFEKGLISPKVLAELQAYADKEKAVLVGIAKQRDVLQKKISIAQSITSGVMGSLNLTSLLETETKQVTKSVTKMVDGIAVTTTQTFDEVVSGGLAGSFKKLVDKTKAFAGNLTQLKKLGLNGNLFKQIVDAGAEGGNATAEAIIAGGADAVKELNGLFGELTTAGSDIAGTATDVMYGLGEDVTNSFIDGLRAQDQALINAAQSLANTFANSFNARLGTAMNVNLTGTQATAGLSMDSTDYIRGRGRVTASGLTPAGSAPVNVIINAGAITDQASLPQVIVDGLGTYVRQSGAGGLTRLLGL